MVRHAVPEMLQRKKRIRLTAPWRQGSASYMGTHQGQSEGRVSEGENVSKDLCNGYHGKDNVKEAKQV